MMLIWLAYLQPHPLAEWVEAERDGERAQRKELTLGFSDCNRSEALDMQKHGTDAGAVLAIVL